MSNKRYRVRLKTKKEKGAIILTRNDIDKIISYAYSIDYVGLKGLPWAVYFAILALFGKRVSEVVELQKRDVWIDEGFLFVRFRIRKKHDGSVPVKDKKSTLKNSHAEMIWFYVQNLKDQDSFLFPSSGTAMGYIYPKYAWDVCKKIANDVGLPYLDNHWFRHSLATRLATQKHTSFELKSWFDWESVALADEYVEGSDVMTEGISAREKW